MKKYYIFYVLIAVSGILLLISLLDFQNPISIPGNIEENMFVLAAGIDKSTEIEGGYRLTIIGEKFSQSSGGGDQSSSQGKLPEIDTTEGQTVFDCVRNFNLSETKSLFWGHIKYILVGDNVAKDNILDVLDFYIRDHELRLNSSVAIVKDISAESFLRSGDKMGKFIPDVLDGVFKNIDRLSYSKEMALDDLMKNFDNEYSDAYIPTLTLSTLKKDEIPEEPKEKNEKEANGANIVISDNSDSGNDKSTSKGDSSEETSNSVPYCVNLNGYSIFERFRLIGDIKDYMARGLNWIHGDVKSGIIITRDNNNNKVSMEILRSNSSIKIKFDGEKPEATVNVRFSSNLAELVSQDNIFNSSSIEQLKNDQINTVKKEIDGMIDYAQTNGVDVLGISDAIYHQYPLKWDKIKDDWKSIFKEMKINANVELNINTTYHIRYPIGSKSGDEAE